MTIANSAVYTAANGDQLYGSFAGTGTQNADGSISFSGIETYSRGTGRFAEAAGRVAVTGTARFTSRGAGVGQYTGVGSIAY